MKVPRSKKESIFFNSELLVCVKKSYPGKNIFYLSAVIKITFYLALPIRPLKQTKRDENDTSVFIGIDLLKTFFSFRLKSSKN